MAGRSKKRKTKKNILIIGEGKSEKQYLIEMKKVEKLKYALKPDLPKKSDYKYLFSFAEDNAEFYSKVYCLVDLDYVIRDDKFAQYSAIKEKTLKNKKNIEVFESYPCLETWFAFHFEYFRKTYDFCDKLIKEK